MITLYATVCQYCIMKDNKKTDLKALFGGNYDKIDESIVWIGSLNADEELSENN